MSPRIWSFLGACLPYTSWFVPVRTCNIALGIVAQQNDKFRDRNGRNKLMFEYIINWTLVCSDQLSPDELELLLQSAQAQLHHNHSHSHLPAAASPLTAAVAPHQLSSLLMMQELGFQWSSAVTETTADTSSSSQQHQDAVLKDDDQEEAPKLASVGSLINSCRHRSSPMTVDYNDIVVDHGGGGAVVLPSVNVSLMQKPCPVVGGEAFEMLCKSGQLAMMPTSGTRLLGSEHMAYDYGPPAHHHRLLQGPSSSYKVSTHAVSFFVV